MGWFYFLPQHGGILGLTLTDEVKLENGNQHPLGGMSVDANPVTASSIRGEYQRKVNSGLHELRFESLSIM